MLLAEAAFIVGICTHFQQWGGDIDHHLQTIRAAGVTSVRDDLTWNSVERQPGQMRIPEAWLRYIDRAHAAGIEPLVILDYGNKHYGNGDKPRDAATIEAFARYAEFVARELRGKVRQYEVWNEWDIAIGGTTPGDAASYARLLAAVYPRIRKADPDALVLAGAPTSGGIRKGWLKGILDAGALHSSDAISIHTYNYSEGGRKRSPEEWLQFVESTEASIREANGGRDFPLYVTEMGWPTHKGKAGMSPGQSAAYLARMFLLARTLPYLKGIWWYDYRDDGPNPYEREHNFGTVRPDGTPKPSYDALKIVSRLSGPAKRIDTGDPDLWVLQLGDTVAMWSAADEMSMPVFVKHPTTRLP